MFSSVIERAVHALSEAFATIPDRDRNGLWRRDGLLDDRAVEPRYTNVPAEAFPILSSVADGCHYALWLDDARQHAEPAVVWISPMDGTPETVQHVAANVTDFLRVVERSGLWRDRDDAFVADVRDRARAARALSITYETTDGLGVVAPTEPVLDRPNAATLRSWCTHATAFRDSVDGWLTTGHPGLALAVARDLIADHDAARISSFADICAQIYRALGRDLLATVAAGSYR